jgi:Fe-S cluster biogenesis protein NfuA
MFIQVEETPNPNTLKFVPGRLVSPHQVYAFTKSSQNLPPFVERLFRLGGVMEVFCAHDFMSVSKAQETSWDHLRPLLLAEMTDIFLQNETLSFEAEKTEEVPLEQSPEDAEIAAEIRALLEERVQPFVATHGGSITFSHFHDGVAYLKLQGACSGCPSATMTLKAGVENMLRHYIPEVKAVESVEA